MRSFLFVKADQGPTTTLVLGTAAALLAAMVGAIQMNLVQSALQIPSAPFRQILQSHLTVYLPWLILGPVSYWISKRLRRRRFQALAGHAGLAVLFWMIGVTAGVLLEVVHRGHSILDSRVPETWMFAAGETGPTALTLYAAFALAAFFTGKASSSDVDSSAADISALSSPCEPPRYLVRLSVRSTGRIQVVPVNTLVSIAAVDYYVELNSTLGRFLLRTPLSELDSQLDPEKFFRVHRSAIVNLHQVRSVAQNSGGGGAATLSDGTQVPVSRARMGAFKVRLAKHGRSSLQEPRRSLQ